MKSNGRALFAGACFLVVILSAGCAALSPASREPLAERVRNYMQAQIEGKWDRAYSFFDSSSREKVARESYVKRPRKLSYTGFTIDEITTLPSGEQATVKVRIDISFMGYDFKGAHQTQTWVKESGGWFIQSETRSRKNPFDTKGKQP